MTADAEAAHVPGPPTYFTRFVGRDRELSALRTRGTRVGGGHRPDEKCSEMAYYRLVGAAAVGVLLGGCSSATSTEDPPAEPSADAASSAAPSPAATGPEVAMTATHRFADGVTVAVKGFTEATIGAGTGSEDETAEEGDPYVIATLVWTNTSAAEVELTPLIVVRSGSPATEAPRVYAGEARDSLFLDPGVSTEYDVGVIVPAEQRKAVTIEITDPVDPSRAVTFAGAIG